MLWIQKIAGGGLVLAESDFSWIIYLVFIFFIVVGPIIKKIAESLGMTREGKSRRPVPPGGPRKRGMMQEMLDGAEEFFRKTREEQEKKEEKTGQEKPKRREYSEYDRLYRERKRELQALREKREERLERRRTTGIEPVKPVVEEPEGLVVIEEGAGVDSRSAQVKEENSETLLDDKWSTEDFFAKKKRKKKLYEKDKSADVFEILDDLPDITKIIVFSEVLAKPKSLKIELEY